MQDSHRFSVFVDAAFARTRDRTAGVPWVNIAASDIFSGCVRHRMAPQERLVSPWLANIWVVFGLAWYMKHCSPDPTTHEFIIYFILFFKLLFRVYFVCEFCIYK